MYAKLFLVFLSLFLVACNDKNDTELQDCSMTACTLNFVIITVSVKDTSDNVVVLGGYEIIEEVTGEDISVDFNNEEYQYFKEQGIYPVLSDAYRTRYQNSTATLTFKGYVANEEVINEAYEVGADCCHISLISGNTEIVLE